MGKPADRPKLVSVCIAAYNDENTIKKIIYQSIEVLKELQLGFEIIVVNDCSSDKTREILEGLKSSVEFLKVMHHGRNLGYGATIKELLYSSSGDVIFTLPGDLQIPPGELKKLLSWLGEYDIIIGRREPRDDPLTRRINSKLYNLAINFLFGTGTKDINSAKLIKHSVIEVIRLVSDGPFIDAELCAKAVKKGFKINEVNIRHHKREYGCPSGDKPQVMWKALKETVSMIGKI